MDRWKSGVRRKGSYVKSFNGEASRSGRDTRPSRRTCGNNLSPYGWPRLETHSLRHGHNRERAGDTYR